MRGCLGCLGSGSLGCGGFVLGALLAILLFAPQSLGGWVARVAAAYFNAGVDGEVRVGGATVAWGEDVRLTDVEVADAEGRVLVRGSLRGSLRGPWHSRFANPSSAVSRVRVNLHEANLEIDADGRLDLVRAFDRVGSSGPRGLLARLANAAWKGEREPFQVEVEALAVKLTDTRSSEGPLTLTKVQLHLGPFAPDGPLALRLSCGVERDTTRGRLDLEFICVAASSVGPGVTRCSVTTSDLPADVFALLLEALTGQRASAAIARSVGGDVDFDLRLEGDLALEAEFELELQSAEVITHVRGDLNRGTLRLTPEAREADPRANTIEWKPRPDVLRGALSPLLPAGVALRVAEEPLPTVRVRLDELSLATGLERGWNVAFALESLAADIASSARFVLVADPTAAIAADAPASSAAYPIEDPLALVRWRRAADTTSPRRGTFEVLWRHPVRGTGRIACSSACAEAEGSGASAEGRLEVDLPGLPVELLREVGELPPDGASLLGQEVRLQAECGLTWTPGRVRSSAASLRFGDLDFALYGGAGRLPIRGRVVDGVARAAGSRPQTLIVNASPGNLTRVLGPLLPWIESFEPLGARGAEPRSLEVSFVELAIPLNGGSLRPTGTLEITPPPLRVTLAPQIARLFGSSEEQTGDEWSPRRFTIDLDDSLVRYTDVEMPVGDTVVTFRRGSFDRKTRELDLEGEVPARLVHGGSDTTSERSGLLADSELPVDVNLSGSIDAPRLFIDHEVVSGMMQRGVERVLELVPSVQEALRAILPIPQRTPPK